MRKPVEKFSLVIGEGKQDLAVLRGIATAAGISDLRYKDYGGKDKLPAFLGMETKSPEFTSGQIQRILITRDADEDWDAAWNAAKNAIQQAFCVTIDAPGKWEQPPHGPSVAAWIAPGTKKEGMIETLCLEAAENSAPQSFECLNAYIECLQSKQAVELHEKERFEIWTISAQGAAKGQKRLPFDQAISRLKMINWENEAFSELRTLLQTMTGESSC